MLSRLLRASEANVGPVFISSSSAQETLSTSSSISLPAPTSILQGDVLVAFLNSGTSTSTWTGPEGSKQFVPRYNAGTGFAIFTRTATVTDEGGFGGTYTFNPHNTSRLTAALLVFRNASYDTVGTVASGNPNLSAPSITLANDKSYVIAYYRDTIACYFTTPTGFTDLQSYGSTAGYATFGKGNLNAGATGNVSTIPSSTADGILVGLGPL